ncbi:hypothetical protein KR767_18855 [Luteibacter anthropi]|uniref:hypothetical protein n=1 Tax=Luteibacter anthropi TaxID=564369 RepID=UPI00203315B4|nr:hypothetical protein [Luteibacter anthropi]URX62081.1 hypothetical protein KR767_18855 [Luteibacter anthropi]
MFLLVAEEAANEAQCLSVLKVQTQLIVVPRVPEVSGVAKDLALARPEWLAILSLRKGPVSLALTIDVEFDGAMKG